MSELNTNLEKATDRIHKLLAIANDKAASEGERDTAMRFATNLMMKHNLDMANFADKTIPQEKRTTNEIIVPPCPWCNIIGGAIAELFMCKFFYGGVPGKQKYKQTFVGLESNIAVAKDMTDWLIKSVTKESRVKRKEHNGDHSFETSFQNAAASRISARCRELRAEAEANDKPKSNSTALVLVDVFKREHEANLAHIANEMGIKLKSKVLKGQTTNMAGVIAGREFGNNVALNTQLK